MEIGGNAIVSMSHVSKSFGTRQVLTDINLTVGEGDFVVIVGRSGSGKSTLLNCIGLLDEISSGEYYFCGNKIHKSRAGFRNNIRANRLGFVFQSYGLIDDLTVKENILLPLKYTDIKFDKRLYEKLDYYIESFNLTEVADSKVKFLSGGEKQRVSIARAMIKNPIMIVADEPTGNLDDDNTNVIINEFKAMNEKGTAVIIVSHDRRFIGEYGKVYSLEDGVLVNEGNS